MTNHNTTETWGKVGIKFQNLTWNNLTNQSGLKRFHKRQIKFTSFSIASNAIVSNRNRIALHRNRSESYRIGSCFICIFFFFFFFFFFSHITQHSIQNTTKQNNRHILHISRSNQKGGREGRTTRAQKSLLYTITYIKKKTLLSINGRGPGPTDSRRCTFTRHYLQEATDPICFSTHVWCKPVLYYCLLRSCKTSKQHSLLYWTYTETRIIIKKT